MGIIGCRVYLQPGCAGTAFPFNCPQDVDLQIACNNNIGDPNLPCTVDLNALADTQSVPFAPLAAPGQSVISFASTLVQGAYYESATATYLTWLGSMDTMPLSYNQGTAPTYQDMLRFWQALAVNHVQNLLHSPNPPLFTGMAPLVVPGINTLLLDDAFGIDIHILTIGALVNPWYDVADCRKFGWATPTYENGSSGEMQWINFEKTRLFFKRN